MTYSDVTQWQKPMARDLGRVILELTMPSSFGAHLPGLAGACCRFEGKGDKSILERSLFLARHTPRECATVIAGGGYKAMRNKCTAMILGLWMC